MHFVITNKRHFTFVGIYVVMSNKCKTTLTHNDNFTRV